MAATRTVRSVVYTLQMRRGDWAPHWTDAVGLADGHGRPAVWEFASREAAEAARDAQPGPRGSWRVDGPREVARQEAYTPTPEQATRWLAQWLADTGDTLREVAARDGVTLTAPAGCGGDHPAEAALLQAVGYGREWGWAAAEAALDRAYRLVGAANPGTGYAWHAGRHPIQQAMAAAIA